MVYARKNQKQTMYDMLNALQQDRQGVRVGVAYIDEIGALDE
jgi:hypothetical protein